MSMDQQELSAESFSRHAANYLTSTVHATGADLDRLAGLGRGASTAAPVRALDLGCGAGHASFALARGGVPRVIAYDPSAAMLGVVEGEARVRGHSGIATHQGSAEELPFEAETFDLVVTRFSAHHWASVPRALQECRRVLVPGGRLVVIDVIASEVPLFDTALQVIEFLRDASHVRDYRPSEWKGMVEAAGFTTRILDAWSFRLEFDAWVARIATPPARVAALRAVFAGLPADAAAYLQLAADGSFASEAAWVEATKR